MKATTEQIQEWKKRYDSKIYEFTARKQGEEDKRAYFRSITPEVLDAWRSLKKTSELKANEVILSNCWIAGDEDIRGRNEYKLALFDWLGVLLDKVESEMVEL